MVQETKVKDKEKKQEDKGYKFKCSGCGRDWEHKVKKTSGLCKLCVEIRRGLMSFVNKGLITKEQMLERVPKLLR